MLVVVVVITGETVGGGLSMGGSQLMTVVEGDRGEKEKCRD